MEKQHLTYFKIENFKRFDSFEMSNLGQFNLIVGDNNVGKTSVLEALTFDEDIIRLNTNFFGVNNFRKIYDFVSQNPSSQHIQNTGFWQLIFKNISEGIKIKYAADESKVLLIEVKSNHQLNDREKALIRNQIFTVVPDLWLKVRSVRMFDNEVKDQIMPAYFEGINSGLEIRDLSSYIPFVPSNLGYGNDMLDIYYRKFNPNKVLRKELEDSLKLLLPNIEEIRPHKLSNDQEVIGVNTINHESILPLSIFGEGVVKLTRLFLEIVISQGERLMVDEIGAGIHFSRLKQYWKTAVRICFKYQVQLFATTHSLECQQAFVEALQDEDMQQFQKDARNITMIEDKEGQVKAITYDYEQFEYALNIGFNTRGGKV